MAAAKGGELVKPQIVWSIARRAWRSNMRDYIIPQMCEINRKDAIDKFVKQFPHKNWEELRRQGWYAVKIQLVPVEATA